MRVLLDTHTFLWFNYNDRRLSQTAGDVIADGENQVLISAAVAWEIAIKYALRRLPELTEDPEPYVLNRIAHYDFESLPIHSRHALRVGILPPIHRDPFDRMLVAQAMVENVPIVTSDPAISGYGVTVIW